MRVRHTHAARRTRGTLAVLGLLLAAATATAAPSAAGETAGASPAGVERISLGNGTTLLRGVDSPAELAASCRAGYFCGYSSEKGFGAEWGCGSTGMPWYGGGWWYNNLAGTNDRVAMYTSSGIYRTPHSPSQDTTANWTPVTSMVVCVA
ncbi:hypothetical protein [Streptomyces sp. KS 21]|uniref:hypothetical protein n=1 Tax=Streptomyces sp. KS 21 TaxID=2485150 RepID=UPI00106328B6|nr:hypothetical protein [Streptomyces sp. KS 21]TDU79987.1 hypothetical protein EDD91_6816 [Streptomyces sp. KS 21]